MIEKVGKLKYLGLHIDYQFEWINHNIDHDVKFVRQFFMFLKN